MKDTQIQFDAALIDSVHSLEWIARYMGKGLLIGKHKSRKLGTGMEFSQFRPYAQGDDLRLLDWKMYAKTGKFFIRLSTLEVDQELTIHIDNSPSMNYEEEGSSKLHIAKIITATLNYIMAQQSDKFSWESYSFVFPKGTGLQHWKRSLISLFESESANHNYEYSSSSKGIHLWITDLYMDLNDIKSTIKSFMGIKRELILFHLIGNKEENLEFDPNSKFIDLETNEEVQVDTKYYARQYKEQLGQHIYDVKRYCEDMGVLYEKVYMRSNIPGLLREFISRYNYLDTR